jgi:hypothetical protein
VNNPVKNFVRAYPLSNASIKSSNFAAKNWQFGEKIASSLDEKLAIFSRNLKILAGKLFVSSSYCG